jgi:tRNA G26 N,N-dimethylase Trm1
MILDETDKCAVTMLIGGPAWTEKATSVDFIRQYTKSLRQKIPTPEWVYDLYDYLEAESSDTAFYTDGLTSMSSPSQPLKSE